MMRGKGSWAVAALITLTACSGKKRPFSELPRGEVEDSGNSDRDIPAATSGPGTLGEGMSAGDPPGQEGQPRVGGVRPLEVGSDDARSSCRGDAGFCAPAADAGGSVACVPTGLRDCTSDLDNDCNGQLDNALDDVCLCTPGSVEPCDEHPGLDGRGQCQQGLRTCIGGAENLTSNWGACEGAVGPGEQDDCSVLGDDSNCDGTTNGGCPCIEGETRPCGPNTENGICQGGAQTCVNGAFGQCLGAVFPATRNCGSPQDNDCDGRPDNKIDNVCECIPGQGNAPCSVDANNSRCDGQGQCVACQANADCSLVSGGRNSCDGGRCIQNLLADGATCQSANGCASGSCQSWARDADRDGVGRQNSLVRTCGTAAPPNPPGAPAGEVWVSVPNGGAENQRFDCCDTDGDAFPGQTTFRPEARSGCAGAPGDFNCDGREDRRFETLAGSALEVLSGFETCEDLGTNCTTIRLIWIGGEPPPCGTPPGVAGASQCLLVDGQGQCQSISGVGIAPSCL
jgi:hypothetical protein